MGAQKTCISQPASKSLETPSSFISLKNHQALSPKNYVKAEREGYVEYIVKCKTETMNPSNGSIEGKNYVKKRMASKENNKDILNNNAVGSQSRQRQHRNGERQEQQSQNYQSNCNKNKGNVGRGNKKVKG